jgi:NAD(P)-dependent dehydrogenase (short-subunit alcohol dehydrogenase family)
MTDKKAILVIGAGDATGGAIARRFAREGYIACVTRRTADKLQPLVSRSAPTAAGARDSAATHARKTRWSRWSRRIERDIAPIEVAVFNIGANVRFGITETTARVYQKVWEMACFGGFLMGREAAKVMLPRGRGTIIFTGATASLRGREGFAAFAGAKHALRALAQSMARELWPKGIHVAHPVIDGAIDTEFIRSNFPERYALKDQQGILSPDSIAEAYWQIHQQPRDAWTHETELRPWMESGECRTRAPRHLADRRHEAIPSSVPLRLRKPECIPVPQGAGGHRGAHRGALRVHAHPARRTVQTEQQPIAGRGLRRHSQQTSL